VTSFDELVKLIYDAAIEPSCWPVFLARFADAVEATTTGILLYDVERRNGDLAHSVRIDPAFQLKYHQYYIGLDCFAVHGSHLITTGRVVPGQVLCPDRVLECSEFYNDFLTRIDIFHELCGCIFREESVFAVLSTLRPKRAGPLDDEEVILLKRLMPHLQGAMQLHRRIAMLDNKATSATDLLDRMPTSCIMVDAHGKVFMLNRRAREIIAQNDGLTITRGRLCTRSSDESTQLQGLIQNAAATGSGRGVHPGGVMKVARPSLRRSFQVMVSPLRSSDSWLGRERPSAVVFITDPDSKAESNERTLARLFGLTAAEARLASILSRGVSLDLAADELSVSRNTVHSQLQRIFEKTGTSRQAELVRFLLNSPATLQSP
jgi:DNA-binding CsgD family transcriptional regulator